MFPESIVPRLQTCLMAWYAAHHRDLPWRAQKDPYPIWVSEVMLQQTQVKTVIPYYHAFLKVFPALEVLARSEPDPVLKAWEGLGYYARARNLHRAADQVMDRHGGRIPDNFTEFRALPGVGDYIASAVLSIAFGQAHAVVDGNVKRVLSRLRCTGEPVNQSGAHRHYKALASQILDPEDPGGFNQAVMELGALICTPGAPDCDVCPLTRECRAFAEGKTREFPRRVQTPPRPCHAISAGIVCKEGKLLITRRSPQGLLGGLWEFPGGRQEAGESAENACVREIREETGLTVRIRQHLTRVRHAYTHFKIEMDVFFCEYVSGEVMLNGPDAYQWITPAQLQDFAFPRANRKFIPLIQTLRTAEESHDTNDVECPQTD